MQQCFRPLVHGNRLHPQQVAFYAATLNLHPATYRSALPSAALRHAGSICAAMLSPNNATASFRCRLLSYSKSTIPATRAAVTVPLVESSIRQLCRLACSAKLRRLATAENQFFVFSGCRLFHHNPKAVTRTVPIPPSIHFHFSQ